MRRFTPFLTMLVLATVFVVACEDSQLPTMVDSESISLAISDGAHDDPGGMVSNPDFFFLPPIVPNPVGDLDYDDGEFNPYLAPKAEVCDLAEGGACFEPFGLDLNTDETHYAYQWHTGDFDLDTLKTYRISVYIGSVETGVLLGYRDVDPVPSAQDVPSDPETLPDYKFRNGSTIPIKVRIENGALCDPPGSKTCASKFFDFAAGGGDLELLSEGELISLLSVPNQGNREDNVTLTMKQCGEELSSRVDIPTYGTCIEIDDLTDDGFPITLTNEAIITVCDLLDVDWPDDPYHQHDLVALHRWHGYEQGGEGDVEALPLAGFCPTTFGAAEPTGFFGYAKAGWGIVRDHVLSAVVPVPLYANAPVALHRGMGGSTTEFSRFQLALPSKMEIVTGDDQIAPVNTAVPDALVVRVSDLEGNAVVGARVRFATTEEPDGAMPGGTLLPSEPLVAYTDASGLAQVDGDSWMLGQNAGQYYLRASGRGIAVDASSEEFNGPRPGLDPYAPLQEHWGDAENGESVQLFEGPLNFSATACAAVVVEDAVNGMVDGNDVYTEELGFEASISGGPAAAATLHLGNDCENLFIGLTVARDGDEKVNSLRIDLDGDGDGRSEGDDVVIIDVVDGSTTKLSDMWLTQRCVSRKQASCGADDDDAPATDKMSAFVNADGLWTYEVAIPLSNVADLEHDLNVALGASVGVSITLQMGNGAQGNTQYPGFASYAPITINP